MTDKRAKAKTLVREFFVRHTPESYSGHWSGPSAQDVADLDEIVDAIIDAAAEVSVNMSAETITGSVTDVILGRLG
jgi:hypothetical protein